MMRGTYVRVRGASQRVSRIRTKCTVCAQVMVKQHKTVPVKTKQFLRQTNKCVKTHRARSEREVRCARSPFRRAQRRTCARGKRDATCARRPRSGEGCRPRLLTRVHAHHGGGTELAARFRLCHTLSVRASRDVHSAHRRGGVWRKRCDLRLRLRVVVESD